MDNNINKSNDKFSPKDLIAQGIDAQLEQLRNKLATRGLDVMRITTETELESLSKVKRGDSEMISIYEYIWKYRDEIDRLINEVNDKDKDILKGEVDFLITRFYNELILREDDFEESLINKLEEWRTENINALDKESIEKLRDVIREHQRNLYLPGFVDLRIQELPKLERELDPNKEMSGVTFIVFEKGNPKKPIGCLNLILYSNETFKEKRKFLKKTTDGIIVVDSAQVFQTNPASIINIGWINIRPDWRGDAKGPGVPKLIVSLLELLTITENTLKQYFFSQNQTFAEIIERDGPLLVPGTYLRNDPSKLPIDTLYTSDSIEFQLVMEIDNALDFEVRENNQDKVIVLSKSNGNEIPFYTLKAGEDFEIVETQEKNINEEKTIITSSKIIYLVSKDGKKIPLLERTATEDSVRVLKYFGSSYNYIYGASEESRFVTSFARRMGFKDAGVAHLVPDILGLTYTKEINSSAE